MFRKIVSNLSFSPALVGQLSFYARRLRKEEITRKLGLIFTILALIVQSMVVFQPSESANAASGNDFINGGLGTGSSASLNNFIKPYDSNTNHLKDILNYFGITRAELTSAKYTSWTAGEKISWGFQPRFSYAQGEREVNITDQNGKIVTDIYGRPNRLFNGTSTKIWGWSGYSQKIGWFAIMQVCGNLVTDIVPPSPPEKKANIIMSKSAINISKSSVDATTTTANANNVVKYLLTVENTGLASKEVTIKENLQDVLEYATVVDSGGGLYNSASKTLTWPTINLGAGEKQSRVFAVKMLNKIPATSQGQSEPTSFDCVMTNVFGNQVDVKVNCPTEKIIEHTTSQLPKTGPTENMIFAGVVLSLVTYFYARTRQVKTEIKLVRRNLNTGTI